MIIPVEDTSYRCKNCDSFSQCEYYHHRRPDSHICKEFRNDWKMKYKMIEILEKIEAEIKELQNDYQEYGWGFDDALEVIGKYKKEVSE